MVPRSHKFKMSGDVFLSTLWLDTNVLMFFIIIFGHITRKSTPCRPLRSRLGEPSGPEVSALPWPRRVGLS